MSDVYAMRRANGDWFALEEHGRMCVPLFQSSHDALMARLRNFGMMLFQPVALNTQLLREIANVDKSGFDLCLVKDPFASLKRSSLIKPSELALRINTPPEDQAPEGGKDRHGVPQNEWWN